MGTNPPGSNLLGIPTTVNVDDVTTKEVDPAAAATLAALGTIASGILEKWIGVDAASAVDSAAVVTAIMTGNWDKMMALVGKFFELAQGEQNSGFYDLCAAVLTDLTGVKVDAEELKKSRFGSGRLAGMETFGGDLYKLLEAEFAPTSGSLEAGDTGPAERFLGFLMNFAIREGNVAALCEAIPPKYKFVEGFRDYGETMARNLGLGRMARRALQPLIQTLVADPLQYQLNEKYTPKRLNTQLAIKAFFRQTITEAQLRTELHQEGYSDDRINFLVGDARPLLGDRELVHLYFRGILDQPTLVAELEARGYASATIPPLIEAERPLLDKADLLDLGLYGAVTQDDVLTGLGKLGYDVTAAGLVWQAFLMRHDPTQRPAPLHVRTRNFAMLRKEYLDGVIDLIEWRDALTKLGYSTDDITAMTEDLLVDQAKGAKKGAASRIPQLSWAQLKEAYKVGILNLTEVTAHLKARGYTDTDVATLLKELPAPPPPTTPPTP